MGVLEVPRIQEVPGISRVKGVPGVLKVRSDGGTEYHFYTMPRCSSMCHHSAISKKFYIFILDLNKNFSAEIISMGCTRSSKQNNIRIK